MLILASVISKKNRFGVTLSESESISESDYIPSEDSEDETHESENIESSDDEKNKEKMKFQRSKIILHSNLLSTPKRISRKNKPSIIHKDFVSKI